MTRTRVVRGRGAPTLVALLVLLALGAAPVSARTVYVAELTGDVEVPGPGDPSGQGFVELSIDVAEGQLCWNLVVELGEPAVAAHVHDGDAGTAGPVVVTLGTPDENGESNDCANGLDSSLLQSIVGDPGGFYVNVHTDTYPDGAIRGQLDGLEITSLTVSKLACPAGVDGPEDIGDPGDPICAPVRPGPIDTPPDGYVWDPEPVGFDWELEVIEPDDNVLTEADASGEGGGTCNPATLTCGTSFSYEFGEILAGETEATQLSGPPGYEFGWVEVISSVEGGPEPVILATDGSSVLFDSSGTDGVAVRFYDITPAGAAQADVVVMKVACPAGLDTPAEVEAAGGAIACSPTGTVGSIGDPPPGYVWDPEPIEFDLEVALETPAENLTLDDASPGGAGDGGCNTVTLVCTDVSAYTWAGVTAGQTTVTQVTAPDGYEFGWADVTEIGGDSIQSSVQGSSITFDTAGAVSQVLVVIYDIVPTGAGPTPIPPGATARPVVTPPATDTGARAGVFEPPSMSGLVAVVTILGVLGAAGLLSGRRSRPSR